jgi:hypothetical protein
MKINISKLERDLLLRSGKLTPFAAWAIETYKTYAKSSWVDNNDTWVELEAEGVNRLFQTYSRQKEIPNDYDQLSENFR